MTAQKFDPITVDYAIEQCTDLAVLRDLARQYRKAMIGEHEKATHFLDIDDCPPCAEAREHGEPSYACDDYKRWQKAYEDALHADSIIGASADPAGARFGIAVDSANDIHVRFRLFAATGSQHLGGCGPLVMRTDEFAAFEALLAPALTDRSDPPTAGETR